jgi:putative component of membrane protein insertase Oxa1/YidC/SpoIIIJ protein YidD
MKWTFLIIIKLYWVIVPEKKRRSCLFKESCSHHVYRHIVEGGFFKGLSALKRRIKKCRKGYQLYSGLSGFEIELADGTIVKENEISQRILEPIYKKVNIL